MHAVLRSLATANPDLYVPGEEAYRIMSSLFDLGIEEAELYRRLLLEGPIQGRHIALDHIGQIVEQDQDELVARYLRFGRSLAAQAGQRALDAAECDARDIGALIVNTCTGYLCPGLTSYLVEDLGLNRNTRLVDIMGMGCGGAMPNLEAAVNHLARYPDQPVLSIAVEICSSTIFMDPDPGLVVSNCIFADGAAAVVLADSPTCRIRQGLLQFIDFESVIYPQHRNRLHYRTEQHKLRNVLDARVPMIAAKGVVEIVQRLLQRHSLTLDDIDHWAVHPGGKRILDKISAGLGFVNGTLEASYDVLRKFGNMSSPSVLFVLNSVLASRNIQGGQYGMLVSFGAGFSVFAALIQFESRISAALTPEKSFG
jgi:predicted naringenin-chalcone synthase